MADAENHEQTENEVPEEKHENEEAAFEVRDEMSADPDATIIGKLDLGQTSGEKPPSDSEAIFEEQAIPDWLQPEFESTDPSQPGAETGDDEITAVYHVKDLIQEGAELEEAQDAFEAMIGEQSEEPEEELGWLGAVPEQDVVSEAAPESATDELTAETDQDLGWLDSISEQEPASEAGFEEATDELPADSDQGLGWLDSVSEQDALAAESFEDNPEEQPATSDQGLGWLDAVGEPDQVSEDAGDDLAESDLALGDSEELDEQVSDMTWLDEMDTASSLGIQEEPELDEIESVEAIAASEAVESVTEADMVDDIGTVPEDPDEVMAWLEKLAARQGADPEELTTIAAATRVSDEVPEEFESEEIPEDPDEAMAWLEHLAAVEETPGSEDIGHEPEVEREGTSEIAEEVEPDEEVIAREQALREAEKAQELDEALGWLEEMVSQPADTAEELEVAAEEAAIIAEASEEVPTEELEVVAEVDEADDEEAMEWLDQLAAEQGASADDLTGPLDEEEIVSYKGAEPAEELVEQVEDLDMEEAIEDEEILEEFLVTDEISELIEGEEQPIELVEEDEELLPVSGERTEEAPPEDDLDWLETLGSVEVETWLEAEEEEATSASLKEEDWLEDVSDEVVSMEEVEFAEDAVDLPAADIPEPSITHDIKYENAQLALKEGKIGQAVSEYDEFLTQATDMPGLIEELEAVVAEHGAQPRLQRVLGDAYAHEGQTEKAIEVYRQALNNL